MKKLLEWEKTTNKASDKWLIFKIYKQLIQLIFAWNVLLVSPTVLKRSLIFSTLLFASIFFFFFWIIHLRRLFYLSFHSLELYSQLGIYFPFSFTFCFYSFLSYLQGLLRQPLCLLQFLFLQDGFGHHLLYNITNLHP